MISAFGTRERLRTTEIRDKCLWHLEMFYILIKRRTVRSRDRHLLFSFEGRGTKDTRRYITVGLTARDYHKIKKRPLGQGTKIRFLEETMIRSLDQQREGTTGPEGRGKKVQR